jgi:hypothetical protein
MRSFLLLEDDYGVDWEVDQEERVGVDHPHRAPLQGRAAAARRNRRRPGQPAPPQHACVSPVADSVSTHRPRRRRGGEQSAPACDRGPTTSGPSHTPDA